MKTIATRRAVPSRGRRVIFSLLATAALLQTARAADNPPPAILDQIPGDAAAVLVVPNVRDLGTKISNVVSRFGVPLPPDLAGFAMRNLGINKGFDEAGSAALVLLKPASPADEILSTSAPAIILLPTTAAKDMLESFSPGTPDAAGISEVTLPGDSATKGYVTSNDHYVIFAQDKGVLSSYLGRTTSFAKSLSPEALKAFASNEVILWTNLTAVGASAEKLIEPLRTGALDEIVLSGGANPDPFEAAISTETVNQWFDTMKEFLTDADSSLVTLHISDSSVSLGLSGTFKRDTPFAKFVMAQKPRSPLTFKGLPSGNFLIAGTFAYDPKSLGNVAGAFFDRLLALDVVAKNPNFAELKKAADQGRQLITSASGASFVLLPGPTEGKGGVITGTLLIDSSNPKQLLTQLTSIIKSIPPAPADADVITTITETPAAVTIKDIKLSKIHIDVKTRAETTDKPVPQEAKDEVKEFHRAFGPEGIAIYNGVIGARIVSILGSDEASLEGSVDAALSNSESLSNDSQISSVREDIVTNPVALLYLPVTRWAMLAQAQQTANAPDPAAAPNAPPPPPPIQIQDGPPIILTAGVNGTTVTAQIILPVQTVSSMFDFWKALQPPPPPPPPGAPLPPPPQ